MTLNSIESAKQKAAAAALIEINSGMTIGLGTGSTVKHFVKCLGERIKQESLKVRCCATSIETDELATSLGIKIEPPQNFAKLDIVIDGADSIDSNLNLIKGGGGALVREKLIAQMSRRFIVIADEHKLSDKLGEDYSLPVAIIPFAVDVTTSRIAKTVTAFLGKRPKVSQRLNSENKPFVTDDGLRIIDIETGAISDPDELDAALLQHSGVVCTGLFLGIANCAYIGKANSCNNDDDEVINLYSSIETE